MAFKLFLKMFALLSMVSVFSCAKKDPTASFENQKNVDTSIEENALQLYTELYSSKMRQGQPVKVKDVSLIETLNFRSEDSDKPNVDVCVVNFQDDKGFVIMTKGDVETPIAIVDAGNFEPKREQRLTIDSVLWGVIDQSIVDIMLNYEKQKKHQIFVNRGYKVVELIEPKLKTALRQKGAYFYPYRPADVAGCVPVALAQILTYYKTITWPIKNRLINWAKIEEESYRNGGEMGSDSPEETRTDLNEVLWWIGLNSGAHYAKYKTSTNSSRALKLMTRNGFIANTGMYEYTVNQVRSGLLENKLTYMHGARSERYFIFHSWSWPDGGHAWVVDGYAKLRDKENKETEMVHINWGWGPMYYNGYFRSNVFNPHDSEAIRMNAFRDGNTNNEYKYGIEMTHVYPSSFDR
ncbi:C10 family peptidase [Porphyromonas circumdentaria]|uniref:Peptidase C10 family protein n=1 Tax=Porphyromonas circumdentaria TaxID=29524 RepID=A0A1T4PIX9_9PORP|nr:C10 family peptidase [Porphyromonas circumdentaria]MBB6276392.1 hypothetical protein [Porphyromonas circumdentaria]SJZ91412.1 Peptidase C10 family protein [Porphyromonas circumdentaria]